MSLLEEGDITDSVHLLLMLTFQFGSFALRSWPPSSSCGRQDVVQLLLVLVNDFSKILAELIILLLESLLCLAQLPPNVIAVIAESVDGVHVAAVGREEIVFACLKVWI